MKNLFLHCRLCTLLTVLIACLLTSAFGMASAAHAMEIPTASLFTLSGSVYSIASPNAYNQAISTSQTVKTGLQQLTHIQYYVVQGQLSSDGKYHYRYYVTTQLGIQAYGIELAANQKAHTQLIAVGIPAEAVQPQTVQPRGVIGNFSASLHLWWYDPVNIHMMDVYDTLYWSSNGTRATVTGTDNYEDDFWDGWTEYTENYAAGVSGDGTEAYDLTYDTYFLNSFFCTALTGSPGVTYIYVYDNEVDGYDSGTHSYYVDTTASGACSGLLNYSWSA